MTILAFIKKSFKPDFKAIKMNYDYSNDPDQFKLFGIQVFFGEQGSGKTITCKAVLDEVHRSYPKALICSNLVLKDLKAIKFNEDATTLLKILANEKLDTNQHYIQFGSIVELEFILKYVKRGKFGKIVLIDEIQNYFNNQESKNVPMWVIEQAAQNRKQSTLVLATSQDYDQIAKPIRRRTMNAIKCATYGLPFTRGAIFTMYKVYNAKTLEFKDDQVIADKSKKIGFYWHSKALRDSFDTLQVIFTGKEGIDVYASQAMAIQSKIVLKMAKK